MASDSCGKVFVSLLLLIAIAATVVALVTDYWYNVKIEGLVSTQERKTHTYRFGFWRRCYDDRPDPFPLLDVDYSGSNCIWIFKDLVPKHEDSFSSDERIRLHLMRSTLGLSITSVACCLFALISLMCASVPGACRTPKKTLTYFASLLLVLIALMAAIASGICFMAARDVEEKDLKMYHNMSTEYRWSFMLHWVGTGFMLLSGCHLLYLLAHSYNDVTSKSQYYYPY